MLFADIYLGYVLKIAIRFFRFRGCRNWPSATATVTALPLTTGGGWGCPTVEIPYKYHIDGEPYTGLHEEPFLLADSLGEYVAQFTAGTSIVVRRSPSQPEISTILENDQMGVG